MIKHLYKILLLVLILTSCGSPTSENESISLDESYGEAESNNEPEYLTYADSGYVKKFYDSTWSVVYSEKEASYYRLAHYINGQPDPNQIVRDFYINDTLQFEGFLQNENPDTPNGLTKWYFKNGKLNSLRHYSNGELNGESKEFYESGILKSKAIYKSGNLNGNVTIYFDEEGKVNKKADYVDGVLHGQFVVYYENGNKRQSVSYIDGLRQGKGYTYFEDGSIQESYSFINDNEDGEYISYYINGSKEITGYYSEGEESRTWTYYDEDGDYKKYQYIVYRTGAICNDGSRSSATGRGACSWHGGVNYWLTKTEKTFVSGTGKYKNHNSDFYSSY